VSVVKLLGGMGNQMFQYAFGRQLIAEGVDISFDTSWYSPEVSLTRPYVLDKFNIKLKQEPLTYRKRVKEGTFPRLINKQNCDFYGYWQHPKYFKHVYSELKKEFCVRERFYTPDFIKLRKEISSHNSLSVHIRRGDFADCGFYIMPIDYYQKAIDFVKAVKNIDRVYIFSDDMKWCKENFKDVTFVHMENYLDLELMKACKHYIIPGNSSLSLWGVYLSENPDKMVVVPDKSRLAVKDWGIYAKRGMPVSWIRI
jgi:hypothetical protein